MRRKGRREMPPIRNGLEEEEGEEERDAVGKKWVRRGGQGEKVDGEEE